MSTARDPVAEPALADLAVFRPVKAGNTFEETVERLAQAVKLGVVPQGGRLPAERELAERLNVSRVTLREAIKALQQAGFVESRRGRTGGTFVTYDANQRRTGNARKVVRSMGHDEVHDALDFRAVVEPGAAELAARRDLDASARRYLCESLDLVANATPDHHRVADSRLHLAIAELSGSASLAAAVTDVQMRLNELLGAIPVLGRNIEHSNAQHDAMVRAILAGNDRKARAAMQQHVDATAALLRGFLA
jgi:DNA-binding FadR family transcriptional regulator